MSKSHSPAAHKEKNKTTRWVVTIFLCTFVISALISWASEEIMAVSTMAVAFLILLCIVLVGIIFDIIGMAVASADEPPFHSMAARKVPGAKESLMLLKNAERVSSICNDVIGDICGVVSGSASATIAAQVLSDLDFSMPKLITLAMSATVAALTVGGKAVGKTFAINSSTKIVAFVGRFIYWFGSFPRLLSKKNSK